MQVSDIMSRDLLAMSMDAPVLEALRAADRWDVHHVLVTAPGTLSGVLCACQLRDLPTGDPLSQYIGPRPRTIAPAATLARAAREFLESGLSCFPVCDGDKLVGVVTRSDLVQRGPDSFHSLLADLCCAFCGSTRHVRLRSKDQALSVCLQCSNPTMPVGRKD